VLDEKVPILAIAELDIRGSSERLRESAHVRSSYSRFLSLRKDSRYPESAVRTVRAERRDRLRLYRREHIFISNWRVAAFDALSVDKKTCWRRRSVTGSIPERSSIEANTAAADLSLDLVTRSYGSLMSPRPYSALAAAATKILTPAGHVELVVRPVVARLRGWDNFPTGAIPNTTLVLSYTAITRFTLPFSGYIRAITRNGQHTPSRRHHFGFAQRRLPTELSRAASTILRDWLAKRFRRARAVVADFGTVLRGGGGAQARVSANSKNARPQKYLVAAT